jgi:hypothetical protein
MRSLTLAAVALTSLLTACSGTQNGAPSGDDLSTSESRFYPFQRSLPLPVATKPGDVLYRSPMLSIDIVNVLADGKPVAAEPSLVLFVGIDTTTVTVQSGTYIYNIDADRMLFWKQGELLDLIEFSIPEDASVLEIRYRLLPYDSDPNPRVYSLTARRVG